MKNDDQKKFESVFKKLGANDTQKTTVKDNDIYKIKLTPALEVRVLLKKAVLQCEVT